MNKKGFTLIELIATITILSIIMAVAIPNVISITRKNKNQTYINDARKLVTLAKYRFESDATISRPNSSSCVIIKMSALDKSELQKTPENGEYNITGSYVMIKYNSTTKKYDYYVQLLENYGGGTSVKGVAITKYSDLVQINAKNDKIKTASGPNNGDFRTAESQHCGTNIE